MNKWVGTVPLVQDGVTQFSAADLNPIISALAERTEYLKGMMNMSVAKDGYTITDIGFTADCVKGSIVYYDAVNGMYKPAKAGWSDEFTGSTNMKPSAASYVKGIMLSDRASDTSATILCSGWLTDTAIVSRLIGGRVPGDYYLQEDGRIDTTIPETAPIVYVGSYTSSGKLYIKPTAPEVYGHAHSGVTVKGAAFSVVNPDSDVAAALPSNAVAYYDLRDNEALANLLVAAGDRAVLIGNGVVMNVGTWGLSADGSLLYTTFAVSDKDTFTVYGITPIMGDTSIVRGVRVDSNNSILTADTFNNTVYLNTNFSPINQTSYRGLCVTNISNDGVSYGPAVQRLDAGAGIAVTPAKDSGCYELSVTAMTNTVIDMHLVNTNGVLLSADALGVFMTFPADKEASIIGTVRVPADIPNNTELRPVLMVKGNGSTIPAFTVTATVVPYPSTAAEDARIQSPVTLSTQIKGATSTNNIYRIETNQTIRATGNSLIIMQVSSRATTSTAVLTAGIYLAQIQEQ